MCMAAMPLLEPGPVIVPLAPATVVSQHVTGEVEDNVNVGFTIYLKIPKREQAKLVRWRLLYTIFL